MSDETIKTPLMDELDSAEAEIPTLVEGGFPEPNVITTSAKPQSEPEPDMVNIAEIMAVTGFDRNVITRFLDRVEVRQWLGGKETHPKYRRASLPAFTWILEQHRAGIKPGALAAMVSNREPLQFDGSDSALVQSSPTPTETSLSITDNRKSEIDYTTSAIQQVADTLLVAIKEAGLLPVREDKTLDREAAAHLLGCKPASVGRLVPFIRPGVWSFVMIQDHLAEERTKAIHRAEERAAKKAAKKAANL